MLKLSYDVKVDLAVLISIISILWTFATFYLTFLRIGKVSLRPIRFYQVSIFSGNIVISLPITLFNSGAKIQVIDDLRLMINDQFPIFDWLQEIESIPSTKPPSFANAFIIEGYKAISKNLEFVSHVTGFRFSEGEYKIQIQMLKGTNWKTLNEFKLTIDSQSLLKIEELGGYFGRYGVLDLKL